MKIAYLFHGHSRTWAQCVDSFFTNVHSIMPGDIFIHTWDRINSKYGSCWNNSYSELTGYYEEISSKCIDIQAIKSAFNPKHIVIETDPGVELALKQIPELLSITSTPAHIGGYNMFYSQKRVFELSELYGNYDVYFSCRLDLFFKNKLDPSELYENKYLTVARFLDNITPIDFYSFGNKDIMKVKSNFVSNIWEYWYMKNDIWNWWPEHAVGQYYNDNNIQCKSSKLDIEILRIF